ncbi:MAG: dihydrolipoamide acetyltransferase family protein [bacterium]|nr:dihydrolipoamide acetyltransferase family protein [bacterium]
MAKNIPMPKMGYDMTEGKILRWLKAEGEAVTKGEPLAEIQTEKVNIEVEAFEGGVLARILHPAGADVPVGETIGIIAAPGEQVDVPAPAAAAPAAPAPVAEAAPVAVAPPAPVAPSAVTEATPAPIRAAGERIKASPLARRIAREKNLSLETIIGSGPGGRIVRKDVEQAQAAPAAAAPVAAAPVAVARGDRRISLTRMRQAIARRLSESKVGAPHFYVTMAIDMTEAVAFRAQFNAAVSETEKATFNDLVVKAVALAARQVPGINASWADTEIIERGDVHVGVAVALPEGLVVPVLRHADQLDLASLASGNKDLINRAKANKLRPDEMQGGTITVSNLGSFGVESFTAIINPPEAAILAVGGISKEPVVGPDDQIRVRSIMRVTLSSDHRVIDGAQAAAFLKAFKGILEQPLKLLLPAKAQA